MTDSSSVDQIADSYPDLDLLRTEAGRWTVVRRVEWWRPDPSLSLMDEERQRVDKGLLGALGLLLGDPNPDYATDVTGAAWSWDAEDGRLPALVGLLTDTPPYGWVGTTDQVRSSVSRTPGGEMSNTTPSRSNACFSAIRVAGYGREPSFSAAAIVLAEIPEAAATSLCVHPRSARAARR